MDSSKLKDKVQDIANTLVTGKNQHAQTIDQYFADDVVFQSPAHVVKGKSNVENVVGLHQAFRSKAEVGEINWNDEDKTATFTVKSRYRLPLSDLPWPANTLAKYDVPVNWKDVSVFLEPDHSAPSPSPSSQGDVDDVKYHVTKVSTPPHAPRYRLLALVYNIIMFGLRLVTPVVIGLASVVISFFQRHPLSQGVIKCAFSAAYELTAWFLNFVVEHVPVLGGKVKSARAKLEAAAHESKAAPNVDSAPTSPAPVEKRKPRQSGRHAPAFGGFEEIQRPTLIEERTSSSSSPNFKGGKAAKSKSTADPPAVALNSALGSNSGKTTKKAAPPSPPRKATTDESPRKATADEPPRKATADEPPRKATADEPESAPAPAAVIAEEVRMPPGVLEELRDIVPDSQPAAPLVTDAPVEGLISDDPSPDNVSPPVSGTATTTDTDSGSNATSPSPSPHVNLHASDGHASKHRKNNKKKRNNKKSASQQQDSSSSHPNYHYSHNVHTIKKAEAGK